MRFRGCNDFSVSLRLNIRFKLAAGIENSTLNEFKSNLENKLIRDPIFGFILTYKSIYQFSINQFLSINFNKKINAKASA